MFLGFPRWCVDCGHKTYMNKWYFNRPHIFHVPFDNSWHGCLLCRSWAWGEERPGAVALVIRDAKMHPMG